MLRNYLTIALRILVKNKVFSLINIFGLATGIASCILLTLYVEDEFSYEKGFHDHERVFRINTTFINNGVEETGANASPPIAPGLANAFPEIETYTRVMAPLNTEINIVRYGDQSFFEMKAFLVDSTFLDVFPYKLKEGDSETALDGPSAALLTEQFAAKVFGDKSPIDELIIINSGTATDTFRVTGVIESTSYRSHIDAEIYMNMNSQGWGRWVLGQTTWANNNIVGSYLKLHEPKSFKNLEAKFPALVNTHAGEELKQSGRQKILKLQPLDDIRLYSNVRQSDQQEDASSITYVYVISTIGVFILLLACINFMNLTTAKSAQRANEVGVRKSMGAFRNNLIRQFLGESFVIVFFALVIAVIMVILALPAFNTVLQKDLSFNSTNLPFISGATLLIAIITAVLAGSYPAFFLSSLRPTQVLKGKMLSADGSQWLRKGLVVAQFVITITLLSSIFIIRQQINFVQSTALGFDTDQVIMIPMRTASAMQQYSTLKESFESFEGVNHISATSSVPSTPLSRDWLLSRQGWPQEKVIDHDVITVDVGYFEAMKINLVSGRDFVIGQDNVPGDTINRTRAVVNESSLKALDIPLHDAVGSVLYFQPENVRYEIEIIGVVQDFHQFSLHRQIGPMLFMLPGSRNYFPYIAASIKMESYNSVTAEMKKIWDQRIDNAPFESIVVNENMKTLYAAERRTSTMLTIAVVIALVISCLGLYGLSVYVAERKTREIGIRKTVGATVTNIVTMLSKEYIILIGISFVVAVPIGYYLMTRWLESFAYKIEPGILIFLASGAVSFSIAWLTVSFESFRAARKNPATTLRN
jgi:putative ABC transport system permease protein